ncbi:ROK family transcriptional regulator [Roseibium marinum]|uniref:Putative NBD/HSP70 family sugar kinase n=1 Tax=Roseibium marinum TaxID=281252 RepID=A0A2S3USU1_9HYPH|nr:ROK family transcriptional regulator [Roseibium marinum]POF30539.1 putative NBD/HSP70 family sugar kinase [Roseibium marinum]
MPRPQGVNQISEKDDFFPIGPSSAAILEAVRVIGPVARSDLPVPTGLSQQTVHRLSEELLEKGFLERRDPVIQGRGKPSPRLAVNPAGAYGFGVSVDTDTVETVWVDLVGNILAQARIDVDPNEPEAVISRARDVAAAQRQALGLDPRRVAGCGVSIQGFRLTRENRFTTPQPLDNWTGFAIEDRFSAVFECPAFAENNATLGAIAELWSGAGKTYPTFAYLSFNYGFGGGVVLEGRPFYGFNRNAGELTYFYLEEEKRDRPALQFLIEVLREEGLEVPNIEFVKSRFDPQWPGVAAWVDRVAPALNRMVRALTAILDPAAIVFGGEAPPALRQMLIEATGPRLPDRYGRTVPGPDYVQSLIPAEPSAVGAGIQAIRRRVLNGH